MTITPITSLIAALKAEGHAPWQVMHWLHDDTDGLIESTSVPLSKEQLTALDAEPAPTLTAFTAAWGAPETNLPAVPALILEAARTIYKTHSFTLGALFIDWSVDTFDLPGEEPLAHWLTEPPTGEGEHERLLALWYALTAALLDGQHPAPVA